MESRVLRWIAKPLSRRSVRIAVVMVVGAALLVWLSVRRPSSVSVSPDGRVTVRVVSPSFLVDTGCFFANWSTSLGDIEVYVIDNATGNAVQMACHQPPDPWDEPMIRAIRIAWHADSRRFLCIYDNGNLRIPSARETRIIWTQPLVGLKVEYEPFRVERADCGDWAAKAVRREFSGENPREREMREVLLEALSGLPERGR